MGQCVLRDCGLDQQNPPSKLESALKRHMQEQFFENFIEKTPNVPVKGQDFNSSLDFPKKPRNILTKKNPKLSKLEFKDSNDEADKFSDIHSKKHFQATKKVMPLIHKKNEQNNAEKNEIFQNENYKKPTTSDIGFDEDFLGGSLSFVEDGRKNNQKHNGIESLKPSYIDQNQTAFNTSNMFQNQIFDNVNTTPSAFNYRSSDDENLGEYEQIFQDDEFLDSDDEDYVKKLKKN